MSKLRRQINYIWSTIKAHESDDCIKTQISVARQDISLLINQYKMYLQNDIATIRELTNLGNDSTSENNALRIYKSTSVITRKYLVKIAKETLITDISAPEAKTAQTYDGGKYQDGKKYKLENYQGLSDGLYILKNGIWCTTNGMATGLKAQKD